MKKQKIYDIIKKKKKKGATKMIKIIKYYSWYDVLVDGVMVLHHINKLDVDDIIKVCKETNTKYTISEEE